MKRPLISFVTPMKERDFRVIKLLKSIRNQNYPQDRIEIIITDGGSEPKVLEECQKYNVKIFKNPKQLAEGAGMGKDQGIWRSHGEFVVIAESDIELIGNEWINNMLKPLAEDKDVFASVPRLYVHPGDNIVNRYLSYVGVDPFAIYRSIEGQIELNKRLKKTRRDDFLLIELDAKEPFCMGSNGFMFRKDLIKKVGDYAQDVEFIARLAKAGYKKFSVVENARVWHRNVNGFRDFLRKRIKWARNYLKIYVNEKKNFKWVNNKTKFIVYILANLLIFPNFPASIKKLIEHKDSAWLLHPVMLFCSTALNIYFTLFSKKMLAQVFGN